MTFLAPAAWGLLALGVPVVALYLIKTRLRRRAVTTLLFWEQLRPPAYNQSLWRKLRRWLSLLLQLAFLAVLVFALARPLTRRESAGGGATVLVLDPSPSMLATDVSPDRWTQALAAARGRVETLRFSDQCAVILAENPPRVLTPWTGSRRDLERLLSGIKDAPRRGGGEGIRDALTLARRLASGRAGGRVALFSDGVWNDPPDAGSLAGVETANFGTPDPVNTGIVAFSARRSLAAPGDWLLAAEVRRFGAPAVDGELEVQRDGHILDLQPLHLEAGKPWRKTWAGHADEAVKFEAHLRTFAASAGGARVSAADRLAADNDAGADLAAVAPVTVDLVAPANGFLEAALDALPAVHWQRRPATDPAPPAPATLSVFYRASPPPDFPAGAAAVLIDPPGNGFWGEAGDQWEHPLVSDYEKDSVPLRFVGLDSVSLQSAREFRPAAGAEIFAQSFGKPLVFGRWPMTAEGGGTRRWLVLPFDLENTDFVLRTAFPVMLGNLVQSLRAEPALASHPLPGEIKSRLTRTVPAPQAVSAHVAPAAATRAAWWAWAPLWWWAAVLGAGWLLAEWWLFSRRITE